jgi:hypothetical protein
METGGGGLNSSCLWNCLGAEKYWRCVRCMEGLLMKSDGAKEKSEENTYTDTENGTISAWVSPIPYWIRLTSRGSTGRNKG